MKSTSNQRASASHTAQNQTDHAPAWPPNFSKPLLTRAEAVAYLRTMHGLDYVQSTFAKFAVTGGGPGFFKTTGRVLYPRHELDRWARMRLGDLIYKSPQQERDAAITPAAA